MGMKQTLRSNPKTYKFNRTNHSRTALRAFWTKASPGRKKNISKGTASNPSIKVRQFILNFTTYTE